jgi:hypothetical protein
MEIQTIIWQRYSARTYQNTAIASETQDELQVFLASLQTGPLGSSIHLMEMNNYLNNTGDDVRLGWFFLIGISILQGISLSGFFYGLLVVAMCLAGMNGILLGFGSLNPNFAWEDPRKMNSGNMGCLGSILAGFVLGISVSVVCAWLPLKIVEAGLRNWARHKAHVYTERRLVS